MADPLTVLIVVTSSAALGSGAEPTGLWLEELSAPYEVFAEAGAEITVASIAGGKVPLDPRSLAGADGEELKGSPKRFLENAETQALLEASPALATVIGAEGTEKPWDIVFLAGGHGTMTDFPGNPALGELVAEQLGREDGVLAAVCHGPAGLLALNEAQTKELLAGRKLTAFTNEEEAAVGLAEAVPFSLQDRLTAVAGEFDAGDPFVMNLVIDGNLVTGQNPRSAQPVAAAALELAQEQAAADTATQATEETAPAAAGS